MKLATIGLLFLSLCHEVHGELYYSLVIFGNNTPPDAAQKISTKSLNFIDLWQQYIPGYITLAPGEIEACVGRRLQGGNETGTVVTSPGLRGQEDRTLQAGSQCPASCQKQTSSYCRNIGCCGKCRRRLRRELQTGGADFSCKHVQMVELSINTYLSFYCGFTPKCSIKAKVMELGKNGTTKLLCP